jgi:hypothetical protein
MDAIALFTSPAALEEALGDRFCEGLDRERAKRRGAPVAADSERCSTSARHRRARGPRRLVERPHLQPADVYRRAYVAGPYAEGAYKVTCPSTARSSTRSSPSSARAFTLAIERRIATWRR